MPPLVSSGTVLGGRYRLRHELARGGMATVWEADDDVLSRRVAVKVLDPALGADEALRTRFRREAIAAARLTHPGIVATYDTGDDEVAFIVMELVDGETLRRLLDKQGRLPAATAVDIAMQVADALAHSHSQGLIHRDVKPGNVMVQTNGRVRVTDFGIAKAAGASDLTRTGMVVGTARYLAPEQLNGRTIDARVDMYSLALVLYEMLSGRLPFDADTEVGTAVARLTSDPEPLASIRDDLPPGLDAVVARGLARHPGERYPTVKEFRDALRPYARTTRDTTPAVGMNAVVVERHPAHRGRTIAIATAVIVAAIAGMLALTSDDAGPPASQRPRPTNRAVRVANVTDFDPDGDNGHENPTKVDLLHDGNLTTVWPTERYNTRDFGGAKDGVGLVLDLGRRRQVSAVKVEAIENDWSAALYQQDRARLQLRDWGSVRAHGTNLGTSAQLKMRTPRTGRYLLLWITELPPAGRLQIREVGVVG